MKAWTKSSGLLHDTHTPILACTANAMKGDDELCFAAGMDGYISKPIRVEELLTKIGKVVTACSPRG